MPRENLQVINLKAYEEVESLSYFKDEAEVKKYRKERLDLYVDHVSFLKSYLNKNSFDVIDIGSGSSAFLYLLEKQGLLCNKSYGVEISSSRHHFAEKWKQDENFQHVENLNKNFVDVGFEKNAFDLFVVIDNTFSYLQPENQDYPLFCLEKAYHSLRCGGFLILELHNYSKLMDPMPKNNEIYFWKENPKTNPYKFSLYRYIFNAFNNHIITESVYISRNGQDKAKREVAFVYSLDTLSQLLRGKFKIKDVFSDYKRNVFDGNSSDMIVVSSKL